MELKLTFDLLPIVAVVISVLAWYVPKFKGWYNALPSESKQLFMAAVLFGIAAIASGLSAAGVLVIYPVDKGWQGFVLYPLVDWVIALMANAGIYKATNYMFGPKA